MTAPPDGGWPASAPCDPGGAAASRAPADTTAADPEPPVPAGAPSPAPVAPGPAAPAPAPPDPAAPDPAAPGPAAPGPAAPGPAAPGPAAPGPAAPGPAAPAPVPPDPVPPDPAGALPGGAGGAVAPGPASAEGRPWAACGSASEPGATELFLSGAGAGGALRLGLGTRCGRTCRGLSGAPGFQRAEIGRLVTVISPVRSRPAIWGGLSAGRGLGAGWAPFSLPGWVPGRASSPAALVRARDFHRPERAAAAARWLRSAASLVASRSTAASGSPSPDRILITAAGSAVSRAPDWCSMKLRVRARNARLSSDWSLVRAATDSRLR